MRFFNKYLFFIILFFFQNLNYVYSSETNADFNKWLIKYKAYAFKEGVSKETIEIVFKDVKFLNQVIKYDRRQPEFFEDTLTYVKKRATKSRSQIARKKLKKNLKLFNKVEDEFNVEKEILLALWGIETNFGKHVGKMDIISSLSTLTFDKRRSDFFSSQLLILLKLVDKGLVDPKTLFGSWAGAYGNFQFMPSTMKNYAIDYDQNNKIELKESLKDALASAANYINKIGWNYKEPCFYRVKLTKDIKKKYINSSARKISNKLKISKWKKKGIIKFDGTQFTNDYKVGLIMPDGNEQSPAYLVFENFEKILKWNRSLRFGISVCTLAEMI